MISEVAARSLTVEELADRLSDHDDFAVRRFVHRVLDSWHTIEDLENDLQYQSTELDKANYGMEALEDKIGELVDALEECEPLACVRLNEELHTRIEELLRG